MTEVICQDTEALSQEVFNKLKAAYGILPSEMPSLRIGPIMGNERIAVTYPDKGEILLDSETLSICQEQDSDIQNCLAFILGHELSHYVNKHGGHNSYLQSFDSGLQNSQAWKATKAEQEERLQNFDALLNAFSSIVSPLRMALNIADNNEAQGRTLDSLSILIDSLKQGDTKSIGSQFDDVIQKYEAKKMEATADFEGGFLGLLAGYDPKDAGMRLLDSAYVRMNLNAVHPKYPSLTERRQIVRRASDRLLPLFKKYELGNYYCTTGAYNQALFQYRDIVEEFKSCEVYNNIGVVYIWMALSHIDSDSIQYKYPVTLDGAPLVSKGAVVLTPEEKALNILSVAESYLKESLRLNDSYSIGLLNLSIVHALRIEIAQGHPELTKNVDIKSELIQGLSSAYKALSKSHKNDNRRLHSNIQLQIALMRLLGKEWNILAPLSSSDLEGVFAEALASDPSNKRIEENKNILDGNAGPSVSIPCSEQESLQGGLTLASVYKEFYKKANETLGRAHPSTPIQQPYNSDTKYELYTNTYVDSLRNFYCEMTYTNSADSIENFSVLLKPIVSSGFTTGCEVKVNQSNYEDLIELYDSPFQEIDRNGGKYVAFELEDQEAITSTVKSKDCIVFKLEDGVVKDFALFKTYDVVGLKKDRSKFFRRAHLLRPG